MKIVFKLFLTISFIFSFFFFLSKPVNAAFSTLIDNIPRPVLSNECFIKHRSKKDFSGTTYDYFTICSNSTPANILRVSSNALGMNTTMCNANYYWNGSSWISDMNATMEVFGSTVNLAPTYTDYTATCEVSGSANYTYTGGSYGLPNPYYVVANQVAFYPDISAVPEIPVVASTFTYFIEYRDNFVTNSWLRLESSKPAYISASWAVGANLFGFDGGEWQLYETDGTQRALLDSSSSYYPPYLYIAGTQSPCDSILRSNYSLRDDNGDFVCRATNNPVVDDIAPPFDGVINFVIEDHDWGAFDWLRVPAKILFDAIDGSIVWFNNLWRGLLDQLIPMPDFMSYTFQEIKTVADEKFNQIDLSSLEDFGDLEEDTMPNVTTTILGTNVTLINFDLIKPHMALLRAIMISSVGLFLIIFNVNQINKLLADNSVTES